MAAPREGSLQSKLQEDLGSSEEAGQAFEVARRLQDWPAPAPARRETAALAARLVQMRRQTGGALQTWRPPRIYAWLLLRAQARVLHRELWVASALVMALGALLTYIQASSVGLPLALVAPLVAAVGVALVYGAQADPAIEIELALPASPRLILLARLALVFAFDLVLGLAASLVLSMARTGLSFWPLVLAWLAPMAFLSSLSFFITVLGNLPEVGILLSLGLWAGLNFLRFQDPRVFPWLAHFPDFFSTGAIPWLCTAAFGLGAAALWLAGSEERWLNPQG